MCVEAGEGRSQAEEREGEDKREQERQLLEDRTESLSVSPGSWLLKFWFQTHSDPFGTAGTCSDAFRSVWTCSKNLSFFFPFGIDFHGFGRTDYSFLIHFPKRPILDLCRSSFLMHLISNSSHFQFGWKSSHLQLGLFSSFFHSLGAWAPGLQAPSRME